MDYREEAPPQSLAGLVKARWTLACSGRADETMTHVATPDGCIELIWRLAGRSWWQGEQPEAFVAGLVTAPTPLLLSGDSRFVGLRLWPWAWAAIGGVHLRSLVNGWQAMATALGPGMPVSEGLLCDHLAADAADLAMSEAILQAGSVAELAALAGRPHRWLQRWFDRRVGLPPRTYLRLLRFQEALSGLQQEHGSLADHAAAHGFADQPHMAREFRAMSGMPARAARARAKGPFV